MIPKTILFFFLIILLNFQHALASEKDKIINKLKKTESLRFNFTQNTNGLIENGKCILLFPKKLKCNYSDTKLKELIINENKMSITQKRYNKTYFYPLSKSSFLKILDKNNLIELISLSNIEIGDYICTSEIDGYGCKQSNEFMANYTIAKCTSIIEWNNIQDTISYTNQLFKMIPDRNFVIDLLQLYGIQNFNDTHFFTKDFF